MVCPATEAVGIWSERNEMKTVNLTEEEHAELLKLRADKRAKASEAVSDEVVRAAGTSEGAKKGWLVRYPGLHHSQVAQDLSKSAHDIKSHQEAMQAHHDAAAFTDDKDLKKHHREVFEAHHNEIKRLKGVAKASDTTSTEVIHCRASSAAGEKLGASSPWKPGEQVQFMWMPAGVSTICAGFRKGSIELTVACDEATAEAVQASLDNWRNERPKQEPFGCVEHREQEASFRISASGGFKWNGDGVYLAAEPTTLGAQNVNGKVHRSWSPSFTTDADYSKATERDGVLQFPEGVRGSRSNPAQITGVDFCVGTLTNRPAFHSMSPVRSREAVMASGTSEGAKEGWQHRMIGLHQSLIDASRKLETVKWGREHIDDQKTGEHLNALESHIDNARGRAMTLAGNMRAKWDRSAIKDGSRTGEATLQDVRDSLSEADEHLKHIPITERNEEHHAALASHIDNAIGRSSTLGDHARRISSKAGTKASDTTPSSAITAHCKENLLRDVPDATKAEIAAYEKCIDEGGAHGDAVYELRKDRKNGFVSSNDFWRQYSVTAGAPVGNQNASGDHEHKRILDELGSFYKMSRQGLEDHVKRSNRVSDLKGADKHTLVSMAIRDKHGNRRVDAALDWEESQKKSKAKASEPTLDSIFTKVNASLTTANRLAEENGVCKLTAQDVYERHSVRATWSDAARKAALEARHQHAGWKTQPGMGEGNHQIEHENGTGKVTYQADGTFRADSHDGGYPATTKTTTHKSKAAAMDAIHKRLNIPTAKAFDAAPSLESIYARAGANSR